MSSDVKVGVVHSSWLDGLRTMTDEEVKDFFDKEARQVVEAAPPKERGRAITEEALRTINGERQDQYGDPEDSFKKIADLWSAYLFSGGDMPTWLNATHVADMMCIMKIAREVAGKGKRDNMVDLIGYAALAARMRGYDD